MRSTNTLKTAAFMGHRSEMLPWKNNGSSWIMQIGSLMLKAQDVVLLIPALQRMT